MRRADREFLALPVVRPEDAALEGSYGLLACLTAAGSGIKRDLAGWRKMLAEPAGLSTALGELLGARASGDVARPLPILVIDQAEELFHADAGVEATRFLERLAEALRNRSMFAIFSIRSDAYAHLQAAQPLVGIEQVPYSLPPFAQGAVKEVIEGPARREHEELGAKALQIDPELTDRLMRDWSGSDALPLLAFTLERLVHDYGSDGRIDLAEYEASGGLRGAIEAAVAKALRAASAAGEISRDTGTHEYLLRMAFVPWLVRVDPETRVAERKVARFERLPAAVQPLVDRLVDAGLLGSDAHQVDGREAKVVEIAHEALLRQWPMLNRLLDEQRDALAALEQVKRDAKAWVAANRVDDALLHRGGRLSHVERLLAREELQAELGAEGRGYLIGCRQRENEATEQVITQQEREHQQLEQTRRVQRWATVLLAAIAFVITTAGVGLFKMVRVIGQNRSDVLVALAASAYDSRRYDSAVRFALSGMAGSDGLLLGFDASAAERQLVRASQQTTLRLKIVGHEEEVRSAVFSPDGTRVVTASWDKTARIWDAATGRQLNNLAGHEKQVQSAAFNSAGTQVVTASTDKTARIWDVATGHELNKLEGHDRGVLSAAFSPDGTRVVTASKDKTVRIWDAATGHELTKLQGHESLANSAAFSPDGTRVVTASEDKIARVWDTRFVAALHGQDLIDAACREVLSVDVDAEPFDGELSHLSKEELQLAPVLDPEIDGDACRPATTWQRIKAIFDWRSGAGN